MKRISLAVLLGTLFSSFTAQAQFQLQFPAHLPQMSMPTLTQTQPQPQLRRPTQNQPQYSMRIQPEWCNYSFWNTTPQCVNLQSSSTRALERLGEKIFFDTNLSALRTQSCASCHHPATGFTDPDAHQPTSLGGDGVSFGTRNSPTLSYVGHVPEFEMAMKPSTGLSLRKAAQNNPGVALLELPLLELAGLIGENIVLAPQPFGGFFLDGRAATLEEQAKIPFFAANEMGLNSPDELVQRLRWSWYSWEFTRQFGYDVYSDSERTLDGVAKALAAFQRTRKFAPFTSKFDRVAKGIDQFSASEARGQALFNGKAGCFFCHTSPQGSEQLFSDFLYRNVGAPRNYEMLNNIGNPDFIDRGRVLISGNPAEEGMFRTPTLRNVSKTAPYMHNGAFKTLHEVVNFYNTRDIAFTPESPGPTMTPAPVVGNMGFTPVEVDDIVAFMRTLTDE